MSNPRRFLRPFLLVVCLGGLGAASGAAAAEPAIENLPGYVPFAELAILPHQDLSVEIDLEGALLDMIAGAASANDPYAGLKKDFAVAKAAVAATAVEQGATDGGELAVAEVYHTVLVAPFCFAAAKTFLDNP